MDNEQQLEKITALLKEQNQLIARLGIIVTRIAGLLLIYIIIQLIVAILLIIF